MRTCSAPAAGCRGCRVEFGASAMSPELSRALVWTSPNGRHYEAMRFPAPGNLVRIINPRLFNPRALIAVLLASTLHKVFLSRGSARPRICSTAKQEASLALLCARLPSALQSAGCGSKATLWGVTLSSSSAEDPQAAALLRQFLQVQGTPHPSLHPYSTPSPRYVRYLPLRPTRREGTTWRRPPR